MTRAAQRALGLTSVVAMISAAVWAGCGSCSGERSGPSWPVAAGGAPAAAPAPARPGGSTPASGKVNARSAVGYNLDYPGDWSGLVPFIDLMKNARAWSGACPEGDESCDPQAQLSLDQHGWVRTLRYKDHPEKSYPYVETVFLTRKGQPGYDGELWIDYEGSGQLDIFNGEVLVRDAKARRIRFRAGEGSVFLRIVATDPEGKGDYLRNIRIYRADHAEALSRGQIFNPDALAYLEPFGSLRFMDWMESNERGLCSGGPEHGEECYAESGKCKQGRCVMAGVWSERPRMDQVSWRSRSQFLSNAEPGRGVRIGGYPVEVMVALANAVGADPHFNMPAAFEDEYAREFARYVKANLAKNLRATVEYSNETWNFGFPQAHYCKAMARKLWPSEQSGYVQFAGSRMQHQCRLWKEVFDRDTERVRCLLSPQTGWPQMARAMVDCPAWSSMHPELGPCHRGTDAIAVSGYFAGCLQEPQNEAKLKRWLAEGKERALDRFFEQLERGGLLECAEEGMKNSLVDTIEAYKNFRGMADARGLELYVYESGTHFNYEGKDPEVEQLFVAATRDPRMEQLYRRNLEGYREAGGTIINAWGWIAPNDMWSNAENIKDRKHPKYRALRDFAEREPCWWPRCDRSQR